MTGDASLVLIISIGSLVVGILGTAFGFWRYFAGINSASEVRQRGEIDKLYALVDVRSSEYDGRFGAMKDRQTAFELDVAKRYVTADNLQRLESDIRQGQEKLINRFDSFAADFNRFVGRMEKRTGPADGQ